MPTTFTAMYDRREDAERVQAELERLGIIDVDGKNIHDQNSAGFGNDGGSSRDGRGFFDQMRDLFVSEEDSHHYAEGVRRGHFLLTVRTDDQNADRVHAMLENSGAVDVDEKSSSWKKEGWTAPAGAAGAGALGATAGSQQRDVSRASGQTEEHIPIVEEQLGVGKRDVSRGGVRVRSYVEEVPVHEQVRLREEHVDVQRRPVDQPLRAGELGGDPFQERSIEVTETAEEAVIGKSARVVEEVVVSKDVEQRTETIDDTVRKTKVDVDRVGDDRSTADRSGAFDRDRDDGSFKR
jgi:uncharacterized protein (TIGR02271 family)